MEIFVLDRFLPCWTLHLKEKNVHINIFSFLLYFINLLDMLGFALYLIIYLK